LNGRLLPKPEDDLRVRALVGSAVKDGGLVLVCGFGDIVLRTAGLCSAEDECRRLKNALVNLGNSTDWNALVKRANAGKLDGVNVRLRPVSAESLENLVPTSTAPLIARDTARDAHSTNRPPPGGLLHPSDAGHALVEHTAP
uniref:IgaA/UmoB family intracellular growth attenuator n=1 Tax=Salmonella enterica TaxID=28901 RepID=UPI00398C6C2A